MTRTLLLWWVLGILLGSILLTSCNKENYNDFEGVWYTTSQSMSIEFHANKAFEVRVQGQIFRGRYTLKRNKLTFDFNDDDLPTACQHLERVSKYQMGNTKLSLYGYNFQIYMIR